MYRKDKVSSTFLVFINSANFNQHTKLKCVEPNQRGFFSQFSSMLNLNQNFVKLVSYNQADFIYGDLFFFSKFGKFFGKIGENLSLRMKTTFARKGVWGLKIMTVKNIPNIFGIAFFKRCRNKSLLTFCNGSYLRNRRSYIVMELTIKTMSCGAQGF